MGKLEVVFMREYLERVRSKWFLLGTLLGPVFFFLVLTVTGVITCGHTPGFCVTTRSRMRSFGLIPCGDATTSFAS